MSSDRDRLELEDAAARRLAQAEFQRPLAVEAGAGTGKTAVLVARVVVWCLGPGWELAQRELAEKSEKAAPRDVAARTLEGVVAITFTEAAAGEMAARVASALAEVARGDLPLGVAQDLLPPQAAERAGCLAAATHRLETRTIHSYCASLLRRWPIEAGIAPGFEVDADGSETEAAAFEVVERAMRRALADPPDPDWGLLAAAGEGPDRLVGAVASLASAQAGDELLEDPFTPGVLAGLRATAVAAVDELLAAIGGRFDAIGRGATAQDVAALGEIRRLLVASRVESWLGPASPFGARDEGPRSRVASWAAGRFNRSEERALEGVDPELVRAAASRLAEAADDLERLDPELYRAAARVLAPLVAATRARLLERGVVSFDGLLRFAHRLLAAHPEVAAEARGSVRQLLVDEFQDTDRLQCDIVRRLALTSDPRPGLFVVGDPKQSIYGWRSADLAAYESFRDELEEAGGAVVRLAVSFRSVPPILAEVGRVVGPVMRRRPGLQPEFQPLVASEARRGAEVFADGCRRAVEAWVTSPGEGEGGRETRALAADRLAVEAEALVADIRAVVERVGCYGKVAVLLRSTSDLDRYLEAMRGAGVPFAVTRERAYFRQREVVAAAALVRVLLEPSDAVAQVVLLRSEAVGVPDAALLPLWRMGLPQLLAAAVRGDPSALTAVDGAAAGVELPAGVPGIDRLAGWRESLRHGMRVLVALRRELCERPAVEFVERARCLWPLQLAVAARYLGSFRVSRLERFWDDLEAILDRRGERPSEVARFLRRAVEEARESPVAPTPPVSVDAVQVMTIHGAKGLDFDHVYLPQLDKGSGGRRGDRVTAVLDHDGGRAASLLGRPSPAFLAAERERDRVADCERVRLLYVAMTRAQERLVLSGAWTAGGGDPDPDRARSLLELAAHRFDPETAGRLRAEGGALDDGHGLRWRTVARVVADAGPLEGAPGRQPGEEPEPPDPEELERARRAAVGRMARPWSGTVSGEAHRRAERELPEEAHPRSAPVPVLARGEDAVAAAVGTAVHEAMEMLPDEPAVDAERLRALAGARLAAAGLDEEWLPPARARLGQVLAGLEGGRCLARWRELLPGLVARELPLLIGPGEEPGPVGFVSGAVDLVAREPGSGRLVVVDFKTDLVDGAGLGERTSRYRPQVAAYARALQGALDLAEAPAAELWFLSADEVVRLDPP